ISWVCCAAFFESREPPPGTRCDRYPTRFPRVKRDFSRPARLRPEACSHLLYAPVPVKRFPSDFCRTWSWYSIITSNATLHKPGKHNFVGIFSINGGGQIGFHEEPRSMVSARCLIKSAREGICLAPL